MYYDKQIRYIDCLENGEKKYNCGYVKILVSGGGLLLEMQIRGLYETDDVSTEVMLEGAGREGRIGSVMILQGRGSFRWEIQDPVRVGEEIVVCQGLQYGQLERIRVQISPRRILQCVWRKPVSPEEVRLNPGRELPPEPLEEQQLEMELQEEQQLELELQEEQQLEPGLQEEQQLELELPEEQQPELEFSEPPCAKWKPEAQRRSFHSAHTVVMREDKWQQLWKLYPHIQPFQDEREYLSLGPEDFVVLRSGDYGLAHNSFLLHGYYNYAHLILTQMSVKGANRYYIGVPGNFYEKEKQVAVMFGFESFECRQEPAREGDFGYYMIRVEL